MTFAIDILSAFFLLLGGVFVLIGSIGIFRMPDFFTKLHAASLIETLGTGFILLGLIIEAGYTLISIKLIFIGLLMLFTGPTATHSLARAAIIRGIGSKKEKKE
ncbi:MAG: hypothetical protein CBD16_00175 [Betaproteobacteria bacterium TMED156]|nr:MAG: hypothetical protein CBD16_00175 [Betaproteobacteria bacterium TMED156]|tara:strand:- start:126 stop:437 length:312 start_codon:yes stop_codon:yes gene_type:complete